MKNQTIQSKKQNWVFLPPANPNDSFRKKLPLNMFKTCLDTFGNVFGHFWNFEIFFAFFEFFLKLDPPGCTGQKTFRKNHLQTCSKHILDTFGNVFGHFWIFEKFLISLIFFWVSTLQGALPFPVLSTVRWTYNFKSRNLNSNWFYIFECQFPALSSGSWTHNFKSGNLISNLSTGSWTQINPSILF